MKKLMFVLAVFLAFQGIASAKEIIGDVTAVDAASNKLSVSYLAEDGTDAQADISVKPETTYTGLTSFAELKVGDEVTVDAAQDPSGAWSATSITVSGAAEELPAAEETAPAAEAAPAVAQ